MKRAELEAKLQGVENAKEIVEFIMSEYGKDIKAEQQKTRDVETKLAELGELTPEKVTAFKSFDPKKLAELEKFKTDTEAAAVMAKKESAVLALLTGKNINEKAAKLILKAERDRIASLELDDKGTVKDADKFIEPLAKDYAEFTTRTEQGGVKPAADPAQSGGGKAVTWKDAISEKTAQKTGG